LCGLAASCTAKVLPEVASSAVTGIESTCLALLWTKFTLTDAWSRPPALGGLVQLDRDRHGRVPVPEPPLPPPPLPPLPLSPELELCATGLTAVTRPFWVLPFGISTVTCSPIEASDWDARAEVDGHDQLRGGGAEHRDRRPAATAGIAGVSRVAGMPVWPVWPVLPVLPFLPVEVLPFFGVLLFLDGVLGV